MTHLRTRAVHAGQMPDPHTGALTTPITQSTAYHYGTLAQGAALFAGMILVIVIRLLSARYHWNLPKAD